MPIYESESIVLRNYNLSEADRIVVFFTRRHGIIRGVAKGAKRLKSKFGSMLEPFSTVQIAFFQKEDRELVSIQDIELARSRFESACDPEYLGTFSYLADLLMAIVPPHDPSETTYRMTAACLDVSAAGYGQLSALRLYFELWLLKLSGYLPVWTSCSKCSSVLNNDEPTWLLTDFHLICSSCRPGGGLTQISAGHRSIFRNVQKLPPDEFVRYGFESAAVIELSSLLRRIIAQAVGREIQTDRELAVRS